MTSFRRKARLFGHRISHGAPTLQQGVAEGHSPKTSATWSCAFSMGAEGEAERTPASAKDPSRDLRLSTSRSRSRSKRSKTKTREQEPASFSSAPACFAQSWDPGASLAATTAATRGAPWNAWRSSWTSQPGHATAGRHEGRNAKQIYQASQRMRRRAPLNLHQDRARYP